MTIAFIGASGYGNLGDDVYPFLLKRYLAGHRVLFFNSDLPKQMPEDIELFVVGGGGVVYNNSEEPDHQISPHFEKMRFYLDYAIEHGKPFGFLSCGFQFRHDVGDRQLESLVLWKPYLQSALFASFRSPACLAMFTQLAERNDGRFYPDLGYLNTCSLSTGPVIGLPSRYVVVIPALSIKPDNEQVLHQVRFMESSGFHPVWMQMGADCDDKRHLDAIAGSHPHWTTIRGITCEAASRVIAGSAFVITGRYHGMVFARANGIPFYMPTRAPHKMMAEDLSAMPTDAFGHIDLIGHHLRGMNERSDETDP